MTYMDVANSGFLYILVILGLLFIAGLCVAFYVKTRKRALELGVSKETLKKIDRSTIIFSIVPSLTIVVSMFALAPALGLPWSWFRLSVIGSAVYELTTAQVALSTLGYADTAAAAAADGSVFGAAMIVMSIGIIAPVILAAIVTKPISQGLQKTSASGNKFSPIMNSCYMIATMVIFISIYGLKGTVAVMVLLTSVAISVLISYIAKNTSAKWIGQFAMPCCLIFGMMSALLWTKLFS